MLSPPLDVVVAVAAAPFVGSFLAALAVRLARGEDVVVGRSHCRACDHTLQPLELVPVVSWIALKGRCAHCGAPIGAFYPAIEIAAVGVAVWAAFVVDGALFWLTVGLGWTLLALIAMDAREFTLSDALTLPLIAAGIGAIALLQPSQLWLHVMGALAGLALMAAVAVAYRAVRQQDGLGFGDAKLMAAAGAWTGVQGLGTVLLYSVAVGIGLAVLLSARGQAVERTTPIPFGVGIAIGLWLTWLYGPLVPA